MNKEKFKQLVYGNLEITPFDLMKLYIRDRKKIDLTPSVFQKITMCFPNWLEDILQYYSKLYNIPLINQNPI